MSPSRTLLDFDTPRLVLDLDVFEANVEAAQGLFGSSGKCLRPHVKAHRTPALALRQLGGSANGVTCATVGEAASMVAAGIRDVLIANELLGRSKLERVAELARVADITIAVDSPECVAVAAEVATRARVTIGVVVDLDLGIGRCGVRTTSSAVRLAQQVEATAGLRFRGLMGYEGRNVAEKAGRTEAIHRAYERLSEVRAAVDRAGIDVEIVSSAGTSTILDALAWPDITEVQAGTYAFMEPSLDGLGLPFKPALSVTATVISRTPDYIVLDAGRKSISCSNGPPDPRSAEIRSVRLFEEHMTASFDGGPPKLGARIELSPSHVPETFNLYDSVLLVRRGMVEDEVEVAARGASS